MMDQDSMQRAEWEHLNTDSKMIVTDDDVDVIAAYQGDDPYVVAMRLADWVNGNCKKDDEASNSGCGNDKSVSGFRMIICICTLAIAVFFAVAGAVSIMIDITNYGFIG
ncbi:MAG: hypothetical protein ACRC8W_01100 [Plesiomonas shigelloides]